MKTELQLARMMWLTVSDYLDHYYEPEDIILTLCSHGISCRRANTIVGFLERDRVIRQEWKEAVLMKVRSEKAGIKSGSECRY